MPTNTSQHPAGELREKHPERRKSKSASRFSDCYRPFQRQEEFHRNRVKYRLFGGAAGPGKTKALLWEAIYQAREVAGSDSLLLRRTYPELESSLLAYFRRDVPRSMYRRYNEAKHIVTWHNGSTTRFGYCRNENDVYQYQGAEFLFIGLDELTHFTLKQWQFLTSRNRCPEKLYSDGQNAGRRILPCMAGASNPGNIGHAWVKALWVDKKPPAGFDQPELYDPRDYDFIRAKLADNPIYANDAEYQRTLAALPEHLRRAFLDGDWNVFAGQYFDVFEFGRHTVRAEALRLEPWWPRWISIDWGFQHPSAVYWHCAVPVSRDSWPVTREQPQLAGDVHQSPVASHQSRIVTYREFVQSGLSPRLKSQQRGVLQQMFGINDPMIQRALTEPANMGYIKNVLGLTELVIPGEESRNKQLREIQQLLASAPIVISLQPTGAAHLEPAMSNVGAQQAAPQPGTMSESEAASVPSQPQHQPAGVGVHQSPITSHQSLPLVLPSVPVDQLLDDHAVEFEECKRWANSDAGQSARMTNPAGFANVRAHAEAHLRAVTPVSRVSTPPSSPELHTTSTAVRTVRESVPYDGSDRDAPGDHWITIDGHHVLIHERQGKQPVQHVHGPKSLTAQIPSEVRVEMVKAIRDSGAPTADDKMGGFHEEYGIAGVDASGKWVVSRDKPGPYANPDVDKSVSPSYQAADPKLAYAIVDPRVAFHVHPGGTTLKGKGWNQPPSEKDKAAAVPGQINIVFAARENKVYFYDHSGVIGKPMKFNEFLQQ